MHDPDQLQIELESFPDEVRPMQAASAEAPFSSPEYLFEVKWDGLRCVLFRDQNGKVRLQDRGLTDLTADVPEVVKAAKRVPPGSVIDGELVATDTDGRPNYPRLRQRPARRRSRSEEHTSELQSQSNLVCRLLLEKKKRHSRHDNRHHRYN